MITVYVNADVDQHPEDFHCSDLSRGEAEVQTLGNESVVNFAFADHAHPSFWVNLQTLHNGEQVKVDVVNHQEQFQLAVN